MINKVEKLNQKNKTINVFDTLVLIVILFICGLFIYGYIYKEPQSNNKIYLTVKVPAENIEELVKNQKSVYFNSVNKPVNVISSRREGDYLLVTLEAPGSIDGDSYVFNGQKVLINQKSEIHSSYFAQGRIISVSNEFK